MTQGRLKHFGWGREGEGLTAEEEAAILDRYHQLFGVEHFDEVTPPPLSDIELRQPRIVPLKRRPTSNVDSMMVLRARRGATGSKYVTLRGGLRQGRRRAL